MIDWWIVPTIITLLGIAGMVGSLFGRDWFEAGLIGMVGAVILFCLAPITWIVCLLLKVFS